ncbi:MAG: Fpg/Nei family DNA glycosylase [Candidatus Anammoximicrobium sp.]|nr:Fpg/Nei family DNA glycosylase [Candidatus Anammoximicrobium sp.]
MPEGDTIFRTAARLRPVLTGRTIAAARARDPGFPAGSLPGRTFAAVEARGKHLLMHLDDQRTIHSHLGMHGSWHLYRPGETWQKDRRQAALVLELPEVVCICFSPKVLQLLSADQLRRHLQLTGLGPDLLAEHVDEAEVLRRFRTHDSTPIGEAVMNQSIVAGIGNVYKSEVLFLTRTNPLIPVGHLSDEQLLRIAHTARQWLAKNLTGYPRRTRSALDGQRLWVYGRSGKPCFACGQRIQLRRQGDQGRTTYWCPHCQAAPTLAGSPAADVRVQP